MRLWRVSSTPWERHGQPTRWFNSRTPGIAVFHASPLAAVCARLVYLQRRTPEALNPDERLYSIRVLHRQVDTAYLSRAWYNNLKETRSVVDVWRVETRYPVLRVPALDGQQHYLVNLRLPLISEIPVRMVELHPFTRSVRKARLSLREGADWLAMP